MSFSILDIQYEVGEFEIDLLSRYPEYAPVLEKTGMPLLYKSERSVEELAVTAAQKLLATNPESFTRTSALIVVSQSSEYQLPSLACEIHRRLQLPPSALAFDINQGCSGFVQALTIAVALLPEHENILIVCADKYRSKLRAGDRSTESVFSDAASAILLSRNGALAITRQSHLTDGSGRRFLTQKIGEHLTMAGADVFLWTRNKVAKQIQAVITEEGLLGRRPHTVVLHQASKLVVEAIGGSLPADIEIPMDFARFGNTVSSSIPILLANNPEILRREGTTLLAGFGVGLSSSVVSVTREYSDLK
jgi:3-oxoacyl-[acyl-carrier-protein] synthase-3